MNGRAAVTALVHDVAERAAKTFAETAGAVIASQWIASGLGADPFNYAAWEKVGIGAGSAGLSAVLSLLLSLLSARKTGTASASTLVAQTSSHAPASEAAVTSAIAAASAAPSLGTAYVEAVGRHAAVEDDEADDPDPELPDGALTDDPDPSIGDGALSPS